MLYKWATPQPDTCSFDVLGFVLWWNYFNKDHVLICEQIIKINLFFPKVQLRFHLPSKACPYGSCLYGRLCLWIFWGWPWAWDSGEHFSHWTVIWPFVFYTLFSQSDCEPLTRWTSVLLFLLSLYSPLNALHQVLKKICLEWQTPLAPLARLTRFPHVNTGSHANIS
jgi:hypothetical protein